MTKYFVWIEGQEKGQIIDIPYGEEMTLIRRKDFLCRKKHCSWSNYTKIRIRKLIGSPPFVSKIPFF